MKRTRMNRPSDKDEIPRNVEQEHSVFLNVMVPASQSAFAITDQQWNQLKERVSEIRPTESLWFSACLALFTVGISFLISVTQLGLAAPWIKTSFWMASTAGFAGSVICAIAYRENRRQRIDDIKAVLRQMEDIERPYRE